MAVSQNELDMGRTNISPRKKVTEMLRGRLSVIFFRDRPGPKIRTRYFEKLSCCHAKPRSEATRSRRECRRRMVRGDTTAPRSGKSAGNMVAAPSRKISGDTFAEQTWAAQIAPQGGSGDDKEGSMANRLRRSAESAHDLYIVC